MHFGRILFFFIVGWSFWFAVSILFLRRKRSEWGMGGFCKGGHRRLAFCSGMLSGKVFQGVPWGFTVSNWLFHIRMGGISGRTARPMSMRSEFSDYRSKGNQPWRWSPLTGMCDWLENTTSGWKRGVPSSVACEWSCRQRLPTRQRFAFKAFRLRALPWCLCSPFSETQRGAVFDEC